MAFNDTGEYPCPHCDKVCSRPGPLASHVKAKHGGESPAGPSADGSATVTDGPGGAYETTEERRPSEPKAVKESKPSLWERVTSSGGADAKGPGPGQTTHGERRPTSPSKRRVSTADFWGDTVVGGGAIVAARSGFVPMSRAMVWTSPVAGEIIEDVTRDTILDKPAQLVCRNQKKWEDLFDLFGLWGAIGVAQANPAQAEQALGFARKRLVSLLPRIAKKIRQQREQEKAAVDALIELMPDMDDMRQVIGADPDADPIDVLLGSLFAAPQRSNVET